MVRHSIIQKVGVLCFIVIMVGMAFQPVAFAGVKSLPIDFSAGVEPLEEGYIGNLEYQDDSIHVRIEENRIFNSNVWIAYIKIASPTQLRTLSSKGFDMMQVTRGKVLAERANAVLAINGDYYSYENTGYLIRQGQLYRTLPGGVRDVLLIDDRGDFHIALAATQETLAEYDMSHMVNTFNFGPALVIDGQRVEKYIDNRNAALKPRQRMCIAQTGPLEYMCIANGSSARGSQGLTLEQLSIIAYDYGAVNAYNLDGGDSTMMFFRNEKINDPNNADTREISDIIYFASAYDPSAGE